MTQPHILFIVLDTLRRDRLSLYGHVRETSPRLDAFAAGATVFQRAIAPAQWTIPAHASMFTGVYPSTHQVTQGYGRLSGMHPTLAEILRAGGYHTAGFCNNPLVGVLDNGLQRGFDAFYNYAGAAVNRPFERGGPLKRRWRRFARPVQNRFAQSDWLFRVSMNPRLVSLWTRFINYKGHTGNSVDDLIAYIGRHRAGGADQPLFAFLNLMGAHLPYRPPGHTLDQINPALRRQRAARQFMGRFNSEAGRWASPADPPLADWERATLHDYYDAEILDQDAHLGRLFDYLARSGALEDTVVVVVADHGEAHGDHDFFGHGFVVYQELVHVPLLIHYPERFPRGRQVMTNISTRRIFHTLLDLAGIQPPLAADDPNAAIDVLTLTRALNGAPDPEGGLVFAEAFPPSTFLSLLEHRAPALIERLRLKQVRRGVYADDHKLALVGDGVEGLFDVRRDPAEAHNIAAHEAARAAELTSKAQAFVQAAEAQRVDAAGIGAVDEAVLDHLRALGYIE